MKLNAFLNVFGKLKFEKKLKKSLILKPRDETKIL